MSKGKTANKSSGTTQKKEKPTHVVIGRVNGSGKMRMERIPVEQYESKGVL